MKMRFPTLFGLVLILLSGGMASSLANAAEEHLLIDRIIAVVGEDVVTLSELRIEATKLELRLRQAKVSPMPSRAAVQKQAFDTLVMNKLQLAEAERLGIEADEGTLTRAISAIAANNQLSVADLRRALESEGMNFDQFRQSMRDEIVVRRLRNRDAARDGRRQRAVPARRAPGCGDRRRRRDRRRRGGGLRQRRADQVQGRGGRPG